MADQVVGERWHGVSDANSAWAAAARDVLTEVAGSYRGVITYFDLGDQIKSRTGLGSRALFHNWIAGVLANVVTRCRAEDLPPKICPTATSRSRPRGSAMRAGEGSGF